MSATDRFWSGLPANPYMFIWGIVCFQDCFAIMQWLEADIWTKKKYFGQRSLSSICGYHLKLLLRSVSESRSTFQEIYDFFVMFLKYLRFFSSFEMRWRKQNYALDRARRAQSTIAIHTFWFGLWANPIMFFCRIVGFQDCFAILEWLKAYILTKNASI